MPNSLDTLDVLIKQKRQQMIEIGLQNGLSSEECVRISEELDVLLNHHHHLTIK